MQTTALLCASCVFLSMLSAIESARGRFIFKLTVPEFVTFGTDPRPPLQLGLGLVVWCNQSAIAIFIPAKEIRTKGGNEPEFVLIEPNKTGVNTPLDLYDLHWKIMGIFGSIFKAALTKNWLKVMRPSLLPMCILSTQSTLNSIENY